MAQVARVAWVLGSSRCALAEGLLTRPWQPLSAQSRAGFTRAAAGSRGAAVRKGSPRLLGAAALALGGALGLYHTVRWHRRSQDLRAEHSAAPVRLGWHGQLTGAGIIPELLRSRGVRSGLFRPLVTLGES